MRGGAEKLQNRASRLLKMEKGANDQSLMQARPPRLVTACRRIEKNSSDLTFENRKT
jgi:hypothetical protein